MFFYSFSMDFHFHFFLPNQRHFSAPLFLETGLFRNHKKGNQKLVLLLGFVAELYIAVLQIPLKDRKLLKGEAKA